jgi:hypothetical protein
MKKKVAKRSLPVVAAGLLTVPLSATMPALLAFTAFCLLFPFRHEVHERFLRIRFWLKHKYLAVGIAAGMISEAVLMAVTYFVPSSETSMFSFHPVMNLAMALGFFVSMSYFWHALLKHYKFRLWEMFTMAGILGIAIEKEGDVFSSVFYGASGIYLWAGTFLVYGAVFSMPYMLLEEEFSKLKRKDTWKRFPLSFLLQYMASMIAAVWIMAVRFIAGF